MDTNLVTQFLGKLSERNGLSIVADVNSSEHEIWDKLYRKYNIKSFKQLAYKTNVDGEKLTIYEINGDIYGVNSESQEYWNLDRRFVQTENGETPEYQINSSVTDKNIIEYLKAVAYLYSEDRFKREYIQRSSKKEKDYKNLKRLGSLVKVEVLSGKYGKAGDFDFDDDDKVYDNDASFEIKILRGDKDFFIGDAKDTTVKYSVYADNHHVADSYSDPGYNWGTEHYTYDGCEVGVIVDKDNNEIDSYADKIPEGSFRELFIDYIYDLVAEAIDNYIVDNDGTENSFDY